jgi:methyl coenzyme M reductase subunit C
MPNETNSINQETGVVAPEAPVLYAGNEVTEATLATEPVTVTDEPSTLDNILTLSLVGVLAVAVIALVIRKAISNRKPAPAPKLSIIETPVEDAPTAPGAAGEVKLNNVDPKTAAMLMAIVADKMQKPINELRFISIKEVEQ